MINCFDVCLEIHKLNKKMSLEVDLNNETYRKHLVIVCRLLLSGKVSKEREKQINDLSKIYELTKEEKNIIIYKRKKQVEDFLEKVNKFKIKRIFDNDYYENILGELNSYTKTLEFLYSIVKLKLNTNTIPIFDVGGYNNCVNHISEIENSHIFKIDDEIINFKDWVSFEPIADKVNFMADRWLRTQLNSLLEHGIIERRHIKVEGINKKVMQWKAKKYNSFHLPRSNDIKQSCRNSAINTTNTFNTNNTINAITKEKEEEKGTIALIALNAHYNQGSDLLNDIKKNISYNDFLEITQKELSKQPIEIDVFFNNNLKEKLSEDDFQTYLDKAKVEGMILEQPSGYIQILT